MSIYPGSTVVEKVLLQCFATNSFFLIFLRDEVYCLIILLLYNPQQCEEEALAPGPLSLIHYLKFVRVLVPLFRFRVLHVEHTMSWYFSLLRTLGFCSHNQNHQHSHGTACPLFAAYCPMTFPRAPTAINCTVAAGGDCGEVVCW